MIDYDNVKVVQIPYNFTPRDYQIPLLKYLDRGGRRACVVWHRRAGKDILLWNALIMRASQEAGLYYYFFPSYAQGRKILWEGMTNDSRKFLDYIPKQLIGSVNKTEMKIVLNLPRKQQSIIRIIGTDNYDSIRGTNPRGCIFSEYAFQDPEAWNVVRPILKANRGWAVFNSTPDGENHFYDLYNMAQKNSRWFSEKLTVEDTGVLSKEDIEEEKEELGTDGEMIIRREYYVDFEVGGKGKYYTNEIKKMKKEGRLNEVRHDPHLPVHTAWDIGRSDHTSIIFYQYTNTGIRIIDYYENYNFHVGHYIKYLFEWQERTNFSFGVMNLPHDAFHKKFEAEFSVAQQLEHEGFRIHEVPKTQVHNGIQLTRRVFNVVRFQPKRVKKLYNALRAYGRKFDDKKKVMLSKPEHNWASHPADAFRYMCVVYYQMIEKGEFNFAADGYENNVRSLLGLMEKEPDSIESHNQKLDEIGRIQEREKRQEEEQPIKEKRRRIGLVVEDDDDLGGAIDKHFNDF